MLAFGLRPAHVLIGTLRMTYCSSATQVSKRFEHIKLILGEIHNGTRKKLFTFTGQAITIKKPGYFSRAFGSCGFVLWPCDCSFKNFLILCLTGMFRIHIVAR